MGRRVAIVGVGVTPHGRMLPEKDWKELLVEAVYESFEDAGMRNPHDVQAGIVAYQGEIAIEAGGIGPIVSDYLGISPAPVMQTHANCSGGTFGIITAYNWVAAGTYDCVVAMGFEKLTDPIHRFELINVSFDVDYDYAFGFTHSDGFSLLNARYRDKYGYDLSPYAQWAMQCDWYAHRHPKALYYKAPDLKMEAVMQDDAGGEARRETAGGEAGSAILICSEEMLPKFKRHKPVFIDGVSFKNTSHYIGSHYMYQGLKGAEKFDIAETPVVAEAATEAFRMAGVEASDIDLAQVYDRQAAGIIQLEAMGFFPLGQGGQAVLDGETAIDGSIPTCTDGGNVRFGFASGAKGGAQIAENVIQLRGEAGDRQVKDAKVGVVSNIGGIFGQAGVIVTSADD